MKTGIAIALAIGVPAVVGLVIWGVTANRIIDKIDDVPGGGGSGGADNCANLKFTSAQLARTNARMPGLITQYSITPDSPALQLMQIAFTDLAPQCPWDAAMVSTISDGSGHTFSWQKLVALTSGKTLAQAASDPEFNAWLSTVSGTGDAGPLRSMIYNLFAGSVQ